MALSLALRMRSLYRQVGAQAPTVLASLLVAFQPQLAGGTSSDHSRCTNGVVSLSQVVFFQLAQRPSLPQIPSLLSLLPGVEGTIVLWVRTDETGMVRQTRVIRSPLFLLSWRLEKAVQAWRVHPQALEGKPICCEARLYFYIRTDASGRIYFDHFNRGKAGT